MTLAASSVAPVEAGQVPAVTIASTAASASADPRVARDLLDRYCVTCHNARLKTASIVLERDVVDAANVGGHTDLWEKVARKMRSRTMPPMTTTRRPTPTEYAQFTTWLESALDRHAAAHPNPGRRIVHRLNRAEYANAVRDLIGVEVDARAYLPPDDSGYGFDNIADVLSVSPGLLERYMLAAGKIGRLALGDPTVKPTIETYRVPTLLAQDDRTSEDLPFGSRGGLAVRHHFPIDGEYLIKVRLQRTYTELIRGLAEPHTLEVRLDRGLVKSFSVGAPAGSTPTEIQEHLRNGDANLEVRVTVKAGASGVGAAFVKEAKVAEGVFQPRSPLASFEHSGKFDTPAAVDAIQIVGPYNGVRPVQSESRRRILVCTPKTADAASERTCARQIIAGLARRAYRRPVRASDVNPLLSVYDKGRAHGSFEEGVEWALERVLVSPDFLFRVERDTVKAAPGTPFRVSDIELASRLSFFLWSSIPDDALLDAAEAGQLSSSAGLSRQVARMLADSRSSALIANFAGQWLYLRNVRGHAPDPNLFPDFDDNLREAFSRETELFFESQLRNDRPVIDLLRADYTFVNERLARHYGMPGIYGSHFRRVTQPDNRRAGLLGQGSILTVTSYAHRTSPVVRGKWLLENLLGAPPPPPPPNVPALPENEEGQAPTSVRERMEAHRKNPVCAACHARMDPLGFALENFDAIGRWRDADETGKRVDSSGTLPDGTTFTGPAAFRNALLEKEEDFVNTVIEKLLTYALGRGLESYDMPVVRSIARVSAPSGHRWSAIMAGIANSVPFTMRAVPVNNPDAVAPEPGKVAQR
jgi:mono/diheme cytochrome c family protein